MTDFITGKTDEAHRVALCLIDMAENECSCLAVAVAALGGALGLLIARHAMTEQMLKDNIQAASGLMTNIATCEFFKEDPRDRTH